MSRHDRGNEIQKFLTESREILFVATEPAVIIIIMFWLKISDTKPGDETSGHLQVFNQIS